MGAWCGHVGEHATRAAKHIILNFNAFVNRNVVLNANVIADYHVVAHVHILPKRAVFANHGTRLDVAEMPNLGAFADAHVVIDVTAFVYIIVFFHLFSIRKDLFPSRGEYFGDMDHLDWQSFLLNIGLLVHQARHISRNDVFGTRI